MIQLVCVCGGSDNNCQESQLEGVMLFYMGVPGTELVALLFVLFLLYCNIYVIANLIGAIH